MVENAAGLQSKNGDQQWVSCSLSLTCILAIKTAFYKRGGKINKESISKTSGHRDARQSGWRRYRTSDQWRVADGSMECHCRCVRSADVLVLGLRRGCLYGALGFAVACTGGQCS